MPGPEFSSPEPNHDTEAVNRRRRQFRQAVTLSQIFYELRKNDPDKLDQETGRILISTDEGSPRYKDELCESKTWLRVLEDGAVEIVSENRIYVSEDDTATHFSDANQALDDFINLVESNAAAKAADPLGYALEKLSRQTTISRSRSKFILRPRGAGGEIEKTYSYELFDGDQPDVDEIETGPVTQSVDEAALTHKIETIREQFLEELRRLLYASVQSENPGQYYAMFPLELRQRILHVLLNEVRLAYETETLKVGSNSIHIDGSAEYIFDEIQPLVSYFFYQSELTADQKIIFRQIKLSQFLKDSLMASDDVGPTQVEPDAPVRPFKNVKRQTQLLVKKWQAAAEAELGSEATKSILMREVLELNEDLFLNVGSVAGYTRELELDPVTGEFSYRFGRRMVKGSIFNPSLDTYHDTHGATPDDPSLDLLEALLLVAY